MQLTLNTPRLPLSRVWLTLGLIATGLLQALALAWPFAGNSQGVALGWLRTSKDFNNNSATLDVNADASPDFGYAATGSEQLLETYYRWRLNKNLKLTPDFQFIRQPGGDKTAMAAKVISLRAKASF